VRNERHARRPVAVARRRIARRIAAERARRPDGKKRRALAALHLGARVGRLRGHAHAACALSVRAARGAVRQRATNEARRRGVDDRETPARLHVTRALVELTRDVRRARRARASFACGDEIAPLGRVVDPIGEAALALHRQERVEVVAAARRNAASARGRDRDRERDGRRQDSQGPHFASVSATIGV